MSLLTRDEVSFYAENGYLLHRKQLFSKEKLEELTSIFEEQLAQKGSKLTDELDTPHFREERLLKFLKSCLPPAGRKRSAGDGGVPRFRLQYADAFRTGLQEKLRLSALRLAQRQPALTLATMVRK
ncbi:hypothetical protein [Paenibacillus ehimensis]